MKEKQPQKPGPKPDMLVIEGDWKSAVKKALKKGAPPKQAPAKKKKRR